MIGIAGSAIGVILTIQRELNIPIWVWVAIGLVGLFIAQFLAFHKVRGQRDALKQNQIPKQIDLGEQLRSLIEEGRKLRILSVTQGESPPLVMAENWRVKVKGFLHDNFDAEYDERWDVHATNADPKQQFTGLATGSQIGLWKILTAALEWLEEFQNQISATPSTLKLPHPPELQISYQKHEFGVFNGEPVITIYAEYRPTGPMRVEAIELHLVGKRVPSLDWKVLEMSQDLWYTSDNKFNVPDGISPGKHDAKLAAFANGEWWGSQPFTIAFRKVNS